MSVVSDSEARSRTEITHISAHTLSLLSRRWRCQVAAAGIAFDVAQLEHISSNHGMQMVSSTDFPDVFFSSLQNNLIVPRLTVLRAALLAFVDLAPSFIHGQALLAALSPCVRYHY